MADFPVRKVTPIPTLSTQETRSEEDVHQRRGAPIHQERHLRIICVGAGASGLLFAYKIQRHFRDVDLTVYEKNPEVSGTWFENHYPGCACDVPAHTYTWSFEPKKDWSAVYASSNEIYRYFNDFAHKHGLHRFVQTNHQVIGAFWNVQRSGWDVTVKNMRTGDQINDQCDILINASGVLNNWRWPAIPGLSEYKGKLLHTANWDDNVDLTDKHVGIIGNGSSGIQILPTIQPHVSRITTFIRGPAWVSPTQGLEQHVFSEAEKEDFDQKPGVLTEYRKKVESGLNGQFALFLKDTPTNNATHDYMIQQMQEKLQGINLAAKLIPDWSVGCRRLTPGVGYLESLTKPNVDVVYGEINRLTEKGCLCDNGEEYSIEVLICATGFDTTFKPRFPLVNHTNTNLQDEWSAEPRSYLGIAAPDFPNYLIFLGPNCPIGNGPVLSAIEFQADYMCKIIDRYQTHNIKSFMPRKEAVDDFIEWKDDFMKQTVWAGLCRSWYKSNRIDGKVTALWPGSTLHYVEAMGEVRWEDWDVAYEGNRFAWLGNGFSRTETDETADWAYYIREEDDGEWLSRGKRREVLTKSGSIQDREKVNYTGSDSANA